MIELKILTPTSVIAKRILKTMALKMGRVFEDMEAPLKSSFSNILEEVIQGSPSYKSIINGIMEGELKGELGVVNGAGELNEMIRILQKTIVVEINKPKVVGKGISGSINIMAVPTDMSLVLSSGVGEYITKKGVSIPWLEWLLTAGNVPIIKDFVITDEKPQFSRTGLLTMKKTSGDSWRVPPQHSGTLQDNFITRAIDESILLFEKTLENQFKKSLKVLNGS